jgi:hypothetical protein
MDSLSRGVNVPDMLYVCDSPPDQWKGKIVYWHFTLDEPKPVPANTPPTQLDQIEPNNKKRKQQSKEKKIKITPNPFQFNEQYLRIILALPSLKEDTSTTTSTTSTTAGTPAEFDGGSSGSPISPSESVSSPGSVYGSANGTPESSVPLYEPEWDNLNGVVVTTKPVCVKNEYAFLFH